MIGDLLTRAPSWLEIVSDIGGSVKRPNFYVGIGAMLYSGAVYAAPAGPSWEIIAIGAVGILISGIGFYAKGISGRQDKLELKLERMNDAMLREYHPKPDVEKLVREVRDCIDDLRADNNRWQEKMEQKFAHLESIYGR